MSGGGQNTYFVVDNGAGFEMKYAGKLFGLFQRMHGEAQFEGTGADLAIAKRIVERHGGTMRAEAMKDQGARFFFTLTKP
jgi:two-component system sensor kinase